MHLILGKDLVISNNILDVATAVDIAQFEHVTVQCNRKLISATSLVQPEDNCPKTLNVPLLPKLDIFSEIDESDAENTNGHSTPATLGKISTKCFLVRNLIQIFILIIRFGQKSIYIYFQSHDICYRDAALFVIFNSVKCIININKRTLNNCFKVIRYVFLSWRYLTVMNL